MNELNPAFQFLAIDQSKIWAFCGPETARAHVIVTSGTPLAFILLTSKSLRVSATGFFI